MEKIFIGMHRYKKHIGMHRYKKQSNKVLKKGHCWVEYGQIFHKRVGKGQQDSIHKENWTTRI